MKITFEPGDGIALHIVQINKTSENVILYNKLNDSENTIEITPTEDGFITACSIILPTEPYESENPVYYSDGNNIYKKVGDEILEVDILEILEVNSLDKEILNFFYLENLKKCYLSLCLKIFNERAFDKCFNGKVNSQLIYKRDLVWAALNVIQYMIEDNQFAEALRLLERIGGCNGLCASENIGGCGCEK